MSWGLVRKKLEEFFDERERPEEVVYEPVQVGAVIVGALAAVGALYWLLWALLVCGGGLFAKVGPALSVLFTSKTPADYGYEGWPEAPGAFEAWPVNVAALVLSLAVVAALWKLLDGSGAAPRRRRD